MTLPLSRNTTYAPLSQVKSEDLNAIQDAIIETRPIPAALASTKRTLSGAADAWGVVWDPVVSAWVIVNTTSDSAVLEHVLGHSLRAPFSSGGAFSDSNDAAIVTDGTGTILYTRSTVAPSTGRVASTVDSGQTWDVHTVGSSDVRPSTVWDGTRFVIIDDNGTKLYHLTEGVLADIPISSVPWGPLRASPDGRIVCHHGSNDFSYSDDGGVTWTLSTVGGSFTDAIRDFIWDARMGLWVAVGYSPMSSAPYIWTSPDGATWTRVLPGTYSFLFHPAIMPTEFKRLCCVRGHLLVAHLIADLGADGSGFLAYSTDAITWRPFDVVDADLEIRDLQANETSVAVLWDDGSLTIYG